jgi:hypothetical protein
VRKKLACEKNIDKVADGVRKLAPLSPFLQSVCAQISQTAACLRANLCVFALPSAAFNAQ